MTESEHALICMTRALRYSHLEPPELFNANVRMQAMRFPMNQHRLELKNAQEARERERELAKEIVDGEMDDDEVGGDFEGM